MSQRISIDASTLLQHFASLERYIQNLREALAITQDKLSKTREAREALRRLREYEGDQLIIAADSQGNAFIQVAYDKKAKPIVHLGLDVFAETSFEDAEKLLLEREHVYMREIQSLQKELEDKVEEYKRVQGVLYALQQQAQQQQMPTKTQG